MNIDKKRLKHEKNEALMVGLSVQEAAIGRQLESAEARAVSRCPKYKESNIYWKRVDELVKKHDDIVKTITDRTESLFADEKEEELNYEDVNEFLNQKSPIKKRKLSELNLPDDTVNLFDVEESIDVVDNKSESIEMKKEELEIINKNKNVSGSKKRTRKKRKTTKY